MLHRRPLALLVLGVLALPGAAAPAGAAPPSPPVVSPTSPLPAPTARVPLRATLAQCTVGPLAADRVAVFRASAPRLRGAAKVQLRFTLLQRLGERGPYRRVRGVAGWEGWESSRAGRPGLVLTKRVEELAAPASYRAVVRFRWLRSDGTVLRTRSRATRTCVEPDPRPDLRLGALSAVREGEGARYTLEVRNSGMSSTTKPASVVLLVGGQTQPPMVVGPLAAGAVQLLKPLAPACAPGSLVEVLVDADGAVDEARESDDAVRRPCPLA
ncbi:hypothetical protein [Conexibacter sp. SYSU D00693]|uniref:hypothetical protein n=1 Tax=Conexibacter sp. SYSU D00693 TaxID=2812560 RepID=UPI00196A2738|nr:hypothetical protein [Conexibacter sp. SYSU D00693]